MEEIETSQDRDEFVPYLEFPQSRQGPPKQSRRREDQNPQRERRIDGKSVNRGHGDPTTRFCSAVVRAGESSRTLRRSNLHPNHPRRAPPYGLSTAEGIEGGRGRPKFSSRLFDLACCVWRAKRLRSPTLALLQLGLDRLQSVYLVRLLDRRDLANHPVESGLVQLSLRI